jgi:hypothetical protein
MEPHQGSDAPDSDEPPPIQSRTDTGGGWAAAGPLIALGLIGLMLVQSCMPGAKPGMPSAAIAPR